MADWRLFYSWIRSAVLLMIMLLQLIPRCLTHIVALSLAIPGMIVTVMLGLCCLGIWAAIAVAGMAAGSVLGFISVTASVLKSLLESVSPQQEEQGDEGDLLLQPQARANASHQPQQGEGALPEPAPGSSGQHAPQQAGAVGPAHQAGGCLGNNHPEEEEEVGIDQPLQIIVDDPPQPEGQPYGPLGFQPMPYLLHNGGSNGEEEDDDEPMSNHVGNVWEGPPENWPGANQQ